MTEANESQPQGKPVIRCRDCVHFAEYDYGHGDGECGLLAIAEAEPSDGCTFGATE